MYSTLTGLFVLLSAIFLTNDIGDSKEYHTPQILIAAPGTYHQGETTVADDEIWMGLYTTQMGPVFHPVRIHVDLVYDPLVDAPDEKTGVQLSCTLIQPHPAVKESPLLFIKDETGIIQWESVIHARPVASVPLDTNPIPIMYTHPAGIFLPPGAWITYSLSDSTTSNPAYMLFAWGSYQRDQAHPEQIIGVAPYGLILAGESPGLLGIPTMQELYHGGIYNGEGHIQVLWAGDLNGDSRLDLILDIADHYNVILNYVLYLSTEPGSVNLVELVAFFGAVGC
jgi:hypothetical protein